MSHTHAYIFHSVDTFQRVNSIFTLISFSDDVDMFSPFDTCLPCHPPPLSTQLHTLFPLTHFFVITLPCPLCLVLHYQAPHPLICMSFLSSSFLLSITLAPPSADCSLLPQWLYCISVLWEMCSHWPCAAECFALDITFRHNGSQLLCVAPSSLLDSPHLL